MVYLCSGHRAITQQAAVETPSYKVTGGVAVLRFRHHAGAKITQAHNPPAISKTPYKPESQDSS